MTSSTRVASAVLLITASACLLPAAGAPNDRQSSSSSSSGRTVKDAVKTVDYGFCSARPDAQSYAPSPVKVVMGKCNDLSQTFSATSDKPSVGPQGCGGYAIAFGPLGNLSPKLNQITMISEWGDTALTSTQCSKAKVSGQAYGERCLDDTCSKTTWDVIEGKPKQSQGKWDMKTNQCWLSVKFTSKNVPYKTLTLDTITTLFNGAADERKRAKGTIIAELKDDKCYSAEGKVAKK